MNLLLRLIYVLIIGKFKPKLNINDKSVLKLRVYPNDIDTNLHLNNGRYLTLMDLGRVDLMLRTPLMKIVKKQHWYPVVGGLNIKFLRSIQPFQKFEIHTQVVFWDEKWIFLQQDFYVKNKLCSTAIVKALFIGQGNKINSQTLLATLGENAPIKPTLTEEKQQWIQSV